MALMALHVKLKYLESIKLDSIQIKKDVITIVENNT